MNKINYLILAVIFLLTACKSGSDKQKVTGSGDTDLSVQTVSSSSESAPAVKRYSVKSGYVVYSGPMGVIQKLYFDNYGAVETFTTELDLGISKTKETQIRKDGFQYSFKEGETNGRKTKWYVASTDYSKMDTKVMKDYNIKDLGKETIAGRVCQKYSIGTGSMPLTTWIWNNIMIKTVTKMGQGEMVIEATQIEEGPVDDSIFLIPEDITFEEF
jgi:hypothetical protein